ncbi:MAG TPA: RNA polymerase sigma factor [Thermodesulforhabdus norvegica]|uniref:RNA polymerase sigma factor n=1 Tax=Thermodesulforhabdus norvegica TaxID=39841 RepID=A0A7C1ATQ1_9BACT|nr:RNA polymerase sigma factor [Thermodesulforhabdus norvegica]
MKGGCVKEAEADLIRKAQKGDNNARNELVNRYYEKIYRAAFRLCGFDREVAFEATQETFLKLMTRLDSFEGKCSLGTWLYRVLINECLQQRRKDKIFRKFLKAWFGNGSNKNFIEPSQVENLARKEEQCCIKKAMNKLSKQQRLVVTLKVMEGLTMREVAEILGISEGAVKSHLFRGIRTLKEELGSRSEL